LPLQVLAQTLVVSAGAITDSTDFYTVSFWSDRIGASVYTSAQQQANAMQGKYMPYRRLCIVDQKLICDIR